MTCVRYQTHFCFEFGASRPPFADFAAPTTSQRWLNAPAASSVSLTALASSRSSPTVDVSTLTSSISLRCWKYPTPPAITPMTIRTRPAISMLLAPYR